MVYFAKFLGPDASFYEIYKRDQLIAFLDTRIKDAEIDPDKRWIRTWNDYLQRIKYFFRWLYNQKEIEDKGLEPIATSDWRENGTIPPHSFIDNSRRIVDIDDDFLRPEEYIEVGISYLDDAPKEYRDRIPRWYKQPLWKCGSKRMQ